MVEGPKDTRHIVPEKSTPAPAAPDGTLQPGQMLQNRYRIMGIIGMGGMGAVYQARDMRFTNVTRYCAVKEMINLAKDQKMREETMRNFEREAEILATLDHPAIPKIYDYFGFGERAYLVLEYIQGKDLEAILGSTEGLLNAEQVRRWGVEICDVLSYLHNHKPDPIVFRDMKPSNVMIDHLQHVRLIDFGIAKNFQQGQVGTMIGTEGYSPPEQYRGIATPKADIYALGATLHHLLTKRDPRLEPPFSFEQAVLEQLNPQVTTALANVVMRALSYNPDERYASAEAMKQSLEAAAPNASVAKSTGTGPKLQPIAPAGGGMPTINNSLPTIVAPSVDSAGHKQPLWSFKVEDAVRSTPLVQDGVVYVGSYDNNLWALDATQGTLRWKYPTEGGIGSSPTYAGGVVLVGSGDRKLHAVDARTGKARWRFETGGKIYTTPRIAAGLIVFGSDDGKVYALRPKPAGAQKEWEYSAISQVRSSPWVDIDSESILFGTDTGDFVCLDLAGKMKWRFSTRRRVLSSPVMQDNIVYFGSDDWHIYALDVKQGYPIWRFRTKGQIISTPALANDRVYFGSVDGGFYAVDSSTGREVWKFDVGDKITTSPTVYKDIVLFAALNGQLYCLHTSTGDLIWTFKSSKPILSSPRIANNIVYIGSDDEHVYAIEA